MLPPHEGFEKNDELSMDALGAMGCACQVHRLVLGGLCAGRLCAMGAACPIALDLDPRIGT